MIRTQQDVESGISCPHCGRLALCRCALSNDESHALARARYQQDRLALEIDHTDLPATRLVELADRLLARALAKGLPFPADVDGEEALRRARAQIQIALDK